jgi:peptide/nickel transport system permease protein
MIKLRKPQSEMQMALGRFWKMTPAKICVWILAVLYFGAIFADILSPYSYKSEDRKFSYAPATKIRFVHDGLWMGPFVYGQNLSFGEYKERIYTDNKNAIHPIKFFVKGDVYKFLGLWKLDRHLLGVDAPGRIYLLGADSRGRDLFSRICYGGRVSLSIGLIGVAISFSIGLIFGGIAGYYGGKVDNILMRIAEMFMMVPGFYLLLALRAAVPDTFNSLQIYFSIVIILSFISWAGLSRIIRGMCLSLRERDYVLAAKACGLSDFAIILKHILPHTLSYSIFAVMLSVPGYILGESAISLLGLGIQDPFASWGNLLSDAMSIVRIQYAPWILWPAFFIFLTVLSFNVIGDALRDCLDPMLRGQK